MESALSVAYTFFLKMKEVGYTFTTPEEFLGGVRSDYYSSIEKGVNAKLNILFPHKDDNPDLFDPNNYLTETTVEVKGEDKKKKDDKKKKKKTKKVAEARRDFSLEQINFLNGKSPETNFNNFMESLEKKLDIYNKEFIFYRINSSIEEKYTTTTPVQSYLRWTPGSTPDITLDHTTTPITLEKGGTKRILEFSVLTKEFNRGDFTLSIIDEERKNIDSVSESGEVEIGVYNIRIYELSNIRKASHLTTSNKTEEWANIFSVFNVEDIVSYLAALEKYYADRSKENEEEVDKILKRFSEKNTTFFYKNVSKKEGETKSHYIKKALQDMKS